MPSLEVGIPARAIRRGQPRTEQLLEQLIPLAGVFQPSDEIAQRLLEGSKFYSSEVVLLLRGRAGQTDPLGGPCQTGACRRSQARSKERRRLRNDMTTGGCEMEQDL